MSTIRLACPRCKTTLELDAAFAGSVARCGQCQAMIAVPAEAEPSAEAPPAAARPRKKGKKSTPWLVAGLLTGVSAAVILGLGVLILASRDDPNAIDTGEAIVDTLGYDPSVNPFTLRSPNALGVPLRRDAVVVIDGSVSAEAWLAAAIAQVADAATNATTLLATESGVEPIAAATSPVAQGLADASAAAERAAQASASMVVWITGEPLDYAVTDRLTGLGVPIGVIQVDRVDRSAEALAEDSGGRYVELDSGQILDWQRDAER